MPQVVSPLADCAEGRFQRVIPDAQGVSCQTARRVLLCSGKFYYELEAWREQLTANDVAIIRLEQLYPFPRAELEALLDAVPGWH